MRLQVGDELRIPELAKLEGDFLESLLPVRCFATLTIRRRISVDDLTSIFRQWILDIQQQHRVTVGWVQSIESFPKRHIHAALVAPIALDCDYAAQRWQQMAAPNYREAAKIEPYQNGLCGLGYVLKHLQCPANPIEFSDNISAFAHGAGTSLFPTTPSQRRQSRRIKAQLKQAPHRGSS